MNPLGRRLAKIAAGSALALASAFGLAACGSSSHTDTPANSTNSTQTSSTQTNSTQSTSSTSPTTSSTSSSGGFTY